ncbi:hypothetical protein HYU94_00115 [Candidatus Daviesbacteria bacterium]|nr:hypothetical protein [Candidatus Daviesbacteria bacterium]
MQTSFYASGFLYSPKTHQILLMQSEQIWSTIEGKCSKNENAETAFARIINELLSLNLKSKDIYPIYDYFHAEKNMNNFVFYAEVKKPKEFDCPFSWIGFGETNKLSFTPHSKQDVIVGERVINAKWRDDEARRNSLTQT